MHLRCDKLKADAIGKHCLTSDHKFSVTAKREKGDIERAALKAAEKEREAVEGLMMNSFYLANKNNRLMVESVNLLMLLNLDTPNIEEMDKFPFSRAFDVWRLRQGGVSKPPKPEGN